MKKYTILTIFSLIISFLMAKVIFMGYQSDKTITVSNTGYKFYFLQLGAYSSYDSMIENTTKLGNYIYNNDDKMYYVFTCITKDENNVGKIEDYFKGQGYNTYTKEFILADEELNKSITDIDLIMNSTNEGIKELCNKSLEKYKEG